MAWKARIPGCFGDQDKLFANHPLDEQRAIELLLEAKRASIGFDEVLNAVRDYLQGVTSNASHIDTQMMEVRRRFSPWF